MVSRLLQLRKQVKDTDYFLFTEMKKIFNYLRQLFKILILRKVMYLPTMTLHFYEVKSFFLY